MSINTSLHVQRGNFSLDVELTLPNRGLTALFGPSGCGKTTILRAIAGLERFSGAFLSVGGKVWQDDRHFLAPHLRPIGMVFQEPSLFPHLNVQRNLEYGFKRVATSKRQVSLDSAIELLGIGHLLARKPQQLSGGEQQRVAIARAVAVCPRLLLLDEPLAALDDQRKQEVMPYLESLHRELSIPVIYVSHSRQEVARLADTMVLLQDGRVQAVGDMGDLYSRLDLSLAHAAEAEVVIDGVVIGYEARYGLMNIGFAGGQFVVTGKSLPLATPVRLQVLARDVSITLKPAQQSSILNVFAATVLELSLDGEAQVMVRLSVGEVVLLSRITRKSADELGLTAGTAVFAQVKSVALLI